MSFRDRKQTQNRSLCIQRTRDALAILKRTLYENSEFKILTTEQVIQTTCLISSITKHLNTTRKYQHTCYQCNPNRYREKGSVPKPEYACDTCGTTTSLVRGVIQ